MVEVFYHLSSFLGGGEAAEKKAYLLKHQRLNRSGMVTHRKAKAQWMKRGETKGFGKRSFYDCLDVKEIFPDANLEDLIDGRTFLAQKLGLGENVIEFLMRELWMPGAFKHALFCRHGLVQFNDYTEGGAKFVLASRTQERSTIIEKDGTFTALWPRPAALWSFFERQRRIVDNITLARNEYEAILLNYQMVPAISATKPINEYTASEIVSTLDEYADFFDIDTVLLITDNGAHNASWLANRVQSLSSILTVVPVSRQEVFICKEALKRPSLLR